MKKALFIALLGIVVITKGVQAQTKEMALASSSSKSKDVVARAAFHWEATEFDFGNLEQGKPQTKVFSFENSGGEPLVISAVQSSCGCTVADYSKEPIAPGAKGFVKLTYNAANKGAFNKVVALTANTDPGQVQLKVRGNVN